MGIFDDSAYQDPTQATPAAAPPVQPATPGQPGPNAIPGQTDFINNLVSAARQHVLAYPGSLATWISPGRAQDAAEAEVRAQAPEMYQRLIAQQSATRNAQLGTAGNIASQGGMGGTNIAPDNIDASIPALQRAYASVFAGNQAQAANPSGAPAAPAANPGAPLSQIQQLDNLFGGKPVNADMVQGAESNNNPNAVSPKGAGGLMQVMPTTGQQPGFGVAPMNGAADNKRFGADYLTAMQNRYKSQTLGLIAYNMGPGATDQWIKNGANPAALPQETRDYVGKVMQAHQAAGLLQAPQQMAQAQPQGQPQGQPAQATDPEAPTRAMYMRLAQVSAMRGDPQGAKSYYDMANLGRPEGTVPTSGGQFKEPMVLTPNGAMSAQDYAGHGAQITAASTAAGTNSQTPVNVITRKGSGVMSQADVLNARGGQMGADGQPNWLPADSPQYKAIQSSQQKEIGDLRNDAALATTGLDTAQQLYNAANGLYTGKGAGTAQDMRKTLQMVATATGQPVPAAIAKSTSQFEQLRYAALNFVQSAAHGFSPRAAQQIVKMIQAAKPGDTTSPQGLKGIIENQIVPAYLRTRAMYAATSNYYQQNPLAADATAKVPNQVPLSQFSVKHYPDNVSPGDYFISRHDGSLKQRPVQ